MRKFRSNRIGKGLRLLGGAFAALGPLALALACNTYDPSLLAAGATLGGSGGAAGSAGGLTAGEAMAGSGASIGGGTSGASCMHVGGAASGSSTGGSAGSPDAGSSGGPNQGDGELIDNMEDGNAQIEISAGRSGYWYVAHDDTAGGLQSPSAEAFEMFELGKGERPGSLLAAYMQVEGFKDWARSLVSTWTNVPPSSPLTTPLRTVAYDFGPEHWPPQLFA